MDTIAVSDDWRDLYCTEFRESAYDDGGRPAGEFTSGDCDVEETEYGLEGTRTVEASMKEGNEVVMVRN